MKKTGITIRIDEDLREAIERIAELKGVTVSEHIREVLCSTHFKDVL